jgi:hypothetical protein
VKRLLIVVLIAAGVLLTSSSAHAYTVYKRGYTGSVTPVPYTKGENSYTETSVFFPARSAQRTRHYPNATQRICLTITVWDADVGATTANQWELYAKRRQCAYVRPGHYALFDPWRMQASYYFGYTNIAKFTWFVHGRRVGWKTVDYDTKGDYLCLTDFCSTENNDIVGGMIWFAIRP